MIRALLVAAILAPTAANAEQRPARYLAIGDSYTIGESVSPAERWPNALVRALRASGVAIDDAAVFARTGWTTDELLAKLDVAEYGKPVALTETEVAASLAPPYDLVSLLIGVNNQYRGRDVANFEAEFTRLLVRAIGYAGGETQRVIVLSIPDWGSTPFAREKGRDAATIATEIDRYNAAKRRICAAHNIAFIDITGFTREALGDPSLLADDGLHPSGKDYARWAEKALPFAREALQHARD